MTDSSPRLSLPFIQPSQAQKHVTHNEAIKVLDAVTQLAVLSATLTEVPASPTAGDCHIIGTGATGSWASRDGQIAVFDGSDWAYFLPHQGWHADVAPLGRLLRFDGTAWVDAVSFQNLDRLGISTAADAVNRLAVASDAALFTHQGAGHQIKVNKLAATDTASVLFQTNWSGRAEFGTIGSDDFAIKVSADGTTFTPAIVTDGATGAVQFPSGQSYFLDTQIADDAVYSLDIPWSDPARILLWLATDAPNGFAQIAITGALAGAGNFTPVFVPAGGQINFHTGTLTGTTGSDGAINLSISVSGSSKRLFIENRLGVSRKFTLSTLGR